MTLKDQIDHAVAKIFKNCGYEIDDPKVTVSQRPDLGDFQSNGAFVAAKQYGKPPVEIAQAVADMINLDSFFDGASTEGAFINFRVSAAELAEYLNALKTKEKLVDAPSSKQKIIVDYGGANIAKPLHVGHLRAAIIGEALKRIAVYMGHDTVGDIHLGDWGLQIGMVITELKRRQPDLPYFNPKKTEYPDEPPFTIADLEEIYPAASKRCKENKTDMDEARQATAELQKGNPGYRAIWQHIVTVSTKDLRDDYAKLNVFFELWFGESTVQGVVPEMVKELKAKGYAVPGENGSLIIPVTEPSDKKEIPPLMLESSHGTELYSTTDLATIVMRLNYLEMNHETFRPDLILYVVDNRQSLHFEQVFRAARKTGIAPPTVGLEHIGFGTVNGTDGKPFKTREGGVMKLKDLITMIIEKAEEKMKEVKVSLDGSDAEKKEVARKVGTAAIKFADLVNYRASNYVFDLERFSSFDGKTGPYLLYTCARIRSILTKLEIKDIDGYEVKAPASDQERRLMLKLTQISEVIGHAFSERAPNVLSEYTYDLALLFNGFYNNHHIISETDQSQKESWICLSALVYRALFTSLFLLGIEVPDRM